MKQNKIISAAVFSAVLTFSQQANAGWVATAVSSAGSAIAAAISSMQAATLSFMAAESAQQHADKEKAQVVNRAIAEAKHDAEQRERLKENVANISDKTADNGQACKSMLMGSTIAETIELKEAMVKSLAEDQKKRTMQTQSPSALIKEAFAEHEPYCEDYDAKRGRCSTVAPGKKQGLDLKAGNVLNPNENQTYTKDELEAAKIYAKSVINPFVSAELPKGYEKSPQGKAYIVAKRVEQQRLSLAYESMNQIIAVRTPNTDIGGAIKKLTGLENPSQLGAIQKVASNFNDPKWHETITSSNREQLLKENVRQSAFKNWMDYNSFLQMERIEGLLSATLAIQAKESSQALLNAQRNAASSASGGATVQQ